MRTDTTLFQDNVLKATVFACTSCTVCLIATVEICTACMDVSWLTTRMNFNTHLSRILYLLIQDSRVKRSQLKAFKLQSVEVTIATRVPTQPGHEKASALSLSLRHPRASLGSESCSPCGAINQSYCLLLLLCSLPLHCSCFARCRHDPIIVRTASNFLHLSSGSLSLCVRLDVHDHH